MYKITKIKIKILNFLIPIHIVPFIDPAHWKKLKYAIMCHGFTNNFVYVMDNLNLWNSKIKTYLFAAVGEFLNIWSQF